MRKRSVWASRPRSGNRLRRVERSWRGVVMDTYVLEKLTGWTPELSPPPDSPLYRWRVLAGDLSGDRSVAITAGYFPPRENSSLVRVALAQQIFCKIGQAPAEARP